MQLLIKADLIDALPLIQRKNSTNNELAGCYLSTLK